MTSCEKGQSKPINLTCENIDELVEAGKCVVGEVIFEYRPTVVEQQNAGQSHHSKLSVQSVILVAVYRVKSWNRKVNGAAMRGATSP